jgi:hypothetical protein
VSLKLQQIFCLLIVVAFLFSAFPLTVHAEAGWLEGWSYRKIFYLESATAETDIQVPVTFNFILYQTQHDMEDLRVTLNDSETLVPAWNQSTFNMANVTFWAKFPVTNTTYYLYWGNVDAEAYWNQTAVFIDIIPNVVGAWSMEEALATDPVLDYSGNNNNGVATGTTIVASPFFSGKTVRSLNGTAADKILGATSPFGFADVTFTVISYFKTSITNNVVMIAEGGANNGWMFYINSNKLAVMMKNGGATAYQSYGSSDAPVNNNPHVGIVVITISTANKDLNSAIYYLDGGSDAVAYSANNDVYVDSVANWSIGSRDTGASLFWNGVLGPQILILGALSALQAANFVLGNYPDPTLEAGKILVRKWATTLPLPSVSTWGDVETYNPNPTPTPTSSVLPFISATFTYMPEINRIGETVFFDATASSSSTPITSFKWSFGDGTAYIGFGERTTHTYIYTGQYTVTLMVSSASGTDKITHDITIEKAPETENKVWYQNPYAFVGIVAVLIIIVIVCLEVYKHW